VTLDGVGQRFVPGLNHSPIQIRSEQGGILGGNIIAIHDQVNVRTRFFQGAIRDLNQDIADAVEEGFGEDGPKQEVLEPRAVATNILALVDGAIAEV
jgi:hypothetical protein